MIDVRPNQSRMSSTGREDRALLRSNPSARTGAGTGAGACPHGKLPYPPACSGLKAKNLGGLGAKPPAVHRTDRCAIWQEGRGEPRNESRSTGSARPPPASSLHPWLQPMAPTGATSARRFLWAPVPGRTPFRVLTGSAQSRLAKACERPFRPAETGQNPGVRPFERRN